jgi:hypothetical protein
MSDTETPYVGELTRKSLDDLKGRQRRGNEEELRAKDVAENQLAAKIAENARKVAETVKKTEEVRAYYREKAASTKQTTVAARGKKALAVDKVRLEETLRNQERVQRAHADRPRERLAQAGTNMGGRALARMRGLLCDV